MNETGADRIGADAIVSAAPEPEAAGPDIPTGGAMTRYPTPTPGRMTATAVLLLASMTIMANAAIAPSLPGMRAHFADVAGIETLAGLVLTLPALLVALTAGLWGRMADRLDRQVLLAVAALAYVLGGTSGLVAGTLVQLLAGRAILGIGIAGMMTLSMAWTADLWQGPARVRFMGLQGAAMSAGGIVVMIGGGGLALEHWRAAFLLYLLAVPAALLAIVTLAPHSRARQAAMPAREAPPTAGLRAGIPWGIGCFVGALAFLLMAMFSIVPTRLPFLLDEREITNPLVVGVTLAAMTLAAIPGALLYERARRFASAMALFAFTFLVMGVGMLLIALASGLAGTLVGVVVMGIGVGPVMPNFSSYIMEATPPEQRGRAAGLLTTSLFAGQFATPLLSAPLVSGLGIGGAFGALAAIVFVLGCGLAIAAQRDA